MTEPGLQARSPAAPAADLRRSRFQDRPGHIRGICTTELNVLVERVAGTAVPHMKPLPDPEPQAGLSPGEPYQRCIHELGQPHPDYQAAQLYATLSLEEALRDMIDQLAQVTRELSVVARRR